MDILNNSTALLSKETLLKQTKRSHLKWPNACKKKLNRSPVAFEKTICAPLLCTMLAFEKDLCPKSFNQTMGQETNALLSSGQP